MNKKQLMVACVISMTLLLALSVFAGDDKFNRSMGFYNTPPGPRLLSPITDKIILTGKDSLEFRWLSSFTGTDHFIFKIYKGYNMYAPDLIYEQSLPPYTSSIKIKSELLEEGRVYTWSLIQVFLGGQKSDKSSSPFKIIKK
jgi:hypothetical protein